MTKPLHSTNIKTSNVILKVTVPKRTGLKRKRGSSGPFYEVLDENEGSPPPTVDSAKIVPTTRDARDLLRCMKDNPESYTIEAVGDINRTHRFRGMPDFVLSTAKAPFMQKMRDHILPFDYDKMKGFKFDESKDFKPNAEIIPPPSWSHDQYPFNYSYHQNPAVKQIVDKFGNIGTTNIQGPRKAYNYPVPFDIDEVPQGPAPEVQPAETLGPLIQELIKEARKLLQQRPIYTRRALQNSLRDLWDRAGENSAKHIYQYVGFIFQSGPWRDAIVRFGVDPRKDPKYRIYQCLMFMLEKEPQDSRAKFQKTKQEKTKRSLQDAEQEKRRTSHLFDGTSVNKDGKVWQVCDITDPLIKEILDTNILRPECDIEKDGWYWNGTWARAKILMKAKMERLLKGETVNDQLYARLARDLPDVYHKKDATPAAKGKFGKEESHLRGAIRSSAFLYKPTSLSGSGDMNRSRNEEVMYHNNDDDDLRPNDDGNELVMEDAESP